MVKSWELDGYTYLDPTVLCFFCDLEYDVFGLYSNLEPQGQPFINGCFNWMIPNLYIGNGCFTKHLFINGCLGFQENIW